MFPADAYAFSQSQTLVLQLVSEAARKVPGLTPDANGLLCVPMSEAEAVLSRIEEVGVSIRVL
jgi:hypothetical protein